ncbi:MAG: nucleoside deaminase [Acidobacteriales bacterium]|nr:nucleoside deaminase [Terriglobales bacterium]
MSGHSPEWFMRQAIELARRNVRESGGPFAALVVRNGEILARGTNLVTVMNDPTAHAEVVAIRNACAAIRGFQLTGCDMYATCEPCPMCLGAIFWARLAKVYFANTKEDATSVGFDDAMIYEQILTPPAQRRIPMLQILRDEGMAAFREWESKPDKTRY